MLSQLENLDKEKEALRTSLDSVGSRVDRVERELDYLETQNGVQPCVDVDDKLIEQQVTLVQEKQKAKYLRLSGETPNRPVSRAVFLKVWSAVHQWSAGDP